MQANAEAKMQANASKREQTWPNVNKRLRTPLSRFLTLPFAIPLLFAPFPDAKVGVTMSGQTAICGFLRVSARIEVIWERDERSASLTSESSVLRVKIQKFPAPLTYLVFQEKG